MKESLSLEVEYEKKLIVWRDKLKDFFTDMYDGTDNPDERRKAVMAQLDKALSQELTQKFIKPEKREQIRSAVLTATQEQEKAAFVARGIEALKPLIEQRILHAKAYEDAEAFEIMDAQGFTPVNERISYSIGGGRLHLHLAPSFEVKDKIEEYYRDALYKVVDIVKNNPDIKMIGGWSWLNATKTFGAMKERLGFTISDIPEEELRQQEHSDDRPRKNALMTREKFLEIYGSGRPENEE